MKPSKVDLKESQAETPTRKKRGKQLRGPKTGHYLRRDALRLMGFSRFITTLDRRTATGRAWYAKRERIYADQGGISEIAETGLTQIDHLMCIDTLIDTGLASVFRADGPGPVDKRTRRFRPIVAEITRLMDLSMRLSQAIGLERRTKPIDIVSRLAEMAREEEIEQQLAREKEGTEPEEGQTLPRRERGSE